MHNLGLFGGDAMAGNTFLSKVPQTSLSNRLVRTEMEKVGEVTNFSPRRYANSCDVAVGYFAYVRKRSALVFFRVFHFWYHWSSIVGRYFEAALCFTTARCRHETRVSTKCFPKPLFMCNCY